MNEWMNEMKIVEFQYMVMQDGGEIVTYHVLSSNHIIILLISYNHKNVVTTKWQLMSDYLVLLIQTYKTSLSPTQPL